MENKAVIATRRIEQYLLKHPNPVVACSFGKDSIVVLDLVRHLHSEIAVVFGNTRCEYPDTLKLKRQLVNEWKLNFIEASPADGWTYWKIIEEFGFPIGQRTGGEATDKCCMHLKKKPMEKVMKEHDWDLVIDGLTSCESRRRYLALRNYPDGYRYNVKWKRHKLSPIHDWTPSDVWDYIEEHNLPYNTYYDCEVPEHPDFTKRGKQQSEYWRCLRVGCWACTIPLKYDPFTLTHLKIFYPKLHQLLLKKGLAQFLLDNGKNMDIFRPLGADWIVENRPCYLDGVTLK